MSWRLEYQSRPWGLSLALIAGVLLMLASLAFHPGRQGGGEWQGPELPPCAPDYLVVC